MTVVRHLATVLSGAVLALGMASCTSGGDSPASSGDTTSSAAVTTTGTAVTTTGTAGTSSASTDVVTPPPDPSVSTATDAGPTEDPASDPVAPAPVPSGTGPGGDATGGDVHTTVTTGTIETLPPVGLDETVSTPEGLDVALRSITAMEKTSAALPGEVSGPGVRVDLELVNHTGAPVDLGTVVVDLLDSDGVPALFMSAPPSRPFTGELADGGTAEATYVFTLDPERRKGVTVAVGWSADAAVVVFEGDAP